MAAFVCRELQKKNKTSWWTTFVYEKIGDTYQSHLPRQGTAEECEKSLDILACFKIIEINWFDIFKYALSSGQRTYARELTEYRHKIAHQNDTPVNDEDAYRALDTMARFMEPIEQECAEQVRKLMREIREKIDSLEESKVVVIKTNQKSQPVITYAAPWRQIAEPHPDVAQGRFRQAEFAADLSQVLAGNAVMEYQDPVEFFNRTYITEGMKGMLIKAIQRVSGKGVEPVIQLKTAFGGGKTHSMLALYHLMNSVKPVDIRGISDVFKEAGITGMPKTKVAVLVGTALDPTKSRRPSNCQV
jgi:hypothetical protein